MNNDRGDIVLKSTRHTDIPTFDSHITNETNKSSGIQQQQGKSLHKSFQGSPHQSMMSRYSDSSSLSYPKRCDMILVNDPREISLKVSLNKQLKSFLYFYCGIFQTLRNVTNSTSSVFTYRTKLLMSLSNLLQHITQIEQNLLFILILFGK